MTTYPTEDGRRITILHREPDPLAAFLAACQGPDPEVSALDWLNALLTDLAGEGCRYVADSADPQAAYAAVSESCRLLRNLRAAVEMSR